MSEELTTPDLVELTRDLLDSVDREWDLEVRMEMYDDPDEALKVVGVVE